MTEPLPWWPTRFMRALTAIGILLPAPAEGHVMSLTVGAGRVDAEVRDGRRSQVRIGLTAFGKTEWAALTHALAAKASATVQLLRGELPRDVEEVFKAVRLPLFPSSAREVSLDCTCPATEVPCGHLNAVFSALVARVAEDPFTVLALRGRDREALLDELKNRLMSAEPLDPDDRSPALTEVMDTFFDCGAAPGLNGAAPQHGPRTPAEALVDQAPPFTITAGGEDVTELLRPVYRALAGEQGS
ncbi:SWIM zinc finger family protein [Amycolatopsis kentuckyensis]|uniref:SWIM zinc finger family protein n=1 Tax=Amycolatopsis kentuckyensis TaxID=218823 RepID=UPI0035672F7E